MSTRRSSGLIWPILIALGLAGLLYGIAAYSEHNREKRRWPQPPVKVRTIRIEV